MTHIKPMAESEGDFTKTEETGRLCYKETSDGRCNEPMTCQVWESGCGGYEDYKYTCSKGHVEWVDGIDS